MIYEVGDNPVDEALAGYCTAIYITVHEDKQIIVRNNGRGIPVGIHPEVGIPTVELVLTTLHAGGVRGGGARFPAASTGSGSRR